MADDDSNKLDGIRRKLPPLAGTGEGAGPAEPTENKPKTKRKKKRPTSASKPDENSANLDETKDASEKVPTPRKKKPAVGGKKGAKKQPPDGEDKSMTATDGEEPIKKKRTRPRSKMRDEDRDGATTPDDELDETPRRRKRSPRRKTKEPHGSQNSLLSGADQTGETAGEKPKKKRVKKKKPVEASGDEESHENQGLAAELADLKDDIIVDKPKETEDEDEEEDEDESSKPQTTAAALKSQPVGRLFIEERGGFRSENKDKLARKWEELQSQLDDEYLDQPDRTTLALALTTHKVIQTFSLFCHGLLAGFAFWHCIMVFVLALNFDYIDFLKHYQRVALPTQALYYLLFIICTVSAFDRYDIGRPTRLFFLRCITLQSGAISCIVYFITMMLSLSIAAIDDKINLFEDINNTLWSSQQESEATLNTWRIMNALRAAGAVFGWIIITIQPVNDRLRKNLESTDSIISGAENKNVMISAA
ncbi:transmembrane protein 237-like [Tubulanus polymorphus]|uniref:transmembrane protein 237-like n=1 Tax=Tubulanus polymorphus TaxID=672921 RepID=UPI003DA332D9